IKQSKNLTALAHEERLKRLGSNVHIKEQDQSMISDQEPPSKSRQKKKEVQQTKLIVKMPDGKVLPIVIDSHSTIIDCLQILSTLNGAEPSDFLLHIVDSRRRVSMNDGGHLTLKELNLI